MSSYGFYELSKLNQTLSLTPPGGFSAASGSLKDVVQLEVTAPGCSVLLPQTGGAVGLASVIQVRSSSSCGVTLKRPGSPLAVMSPGDTWQVLLASDGWEAWKISGVNFNSTGAALAGSGLRVTRNGALNVVYQSVQDISGVSTMTITAGLNASLLKVWSGETELNFPVLPAGFWFALQVGINANPVSCEGTGTTVKPQVNGQAVLQVPPGAICTFVSDGANYWLSAGSVNPLWSQPPTQTTLALSLQQTWANLEPVQARTPVLLVHTSPWNGSNQHLQQSCTIYTGDVTGSRDVIFDTVTNTQDFMVTFCAGVQGSPSSGRTVSVSANTSSSFRLSVVNDPQTSSVLDTVLIGSVSTSQAG